MHDEREARQAGLDLFKHIEVEGLAALEFEGAMRSADSAGEGIAASLFNEILGFLGIGEAGVTFLDFDVLFDAAEHTELGLDGDTLGVGGIDDAFGDGDVFLKWIVRGINHH